MSTSGNYPWATISFKTLITNYVRLQNEVVKQVRAIASSISHATPGRFLLLQFGMAQVTQVGESISNLISQVNTTINNMVRNQKTQ